MKVHRLIPIIVMALFVFAGCDKPIDGGCTEDKYEVCADGTQYKAAHCDNGELFTIDYAADPCGDNVEALNSTKKHNLSPDATPGEIADLAHGNTTFACELYKNIKGTPGNFFYSPFSISMAIAMTYAGAEGETRFQMADTMRFTLGDDRLHNAFNAVDLALESRGKDGQGQDGEGFRLKIANATWGQSGYPFQNTFLDVMMENYGAGMHLLDFITKPEDSRVIINDWVAKETENKIKDLLKPGFINSITRLVLTNAIYFNAAWQSQFDKGGGNQPFTLLDGGKISVPMMNKKSFFAYFGGSSFEAIELPYKGRELSMLVIAPSAGSFGSVEDSFSADFINDIISSLQMKKVDLTMPKFEIKKDFKLSETLKDMGMVDAFSPSLADFSGIVDGHDQLFISTVVHKACIAVDEKGTEAAAATGIGMGNGASPSSNNVTLKLDRPFIFLIRDIPTGTVLFLGRMTNPSE